MGYRKTARSLNPLGIGEGFEQKKLTSRKSLDCLNPLGIGEGFELSNYVQCIVSVGLNPLGIGEGFEPYRGIVAQKAAEVLIP